MRTAIILAAGSSRRFGQANKLLQPLYGAPVVAHVLAVARRSARRTIVVTGRDRACVGRIASRMGAEVVHAARHRDGMGASLAAGLSRLRPIDRELLIFLGDMPYVPFPVRWRLGAHDAVRPIHNGVAGHPVLLRTALARCVPLAGDRGMAPLLAGRRIAFVRGNVGSILDLDTRAALRAARGSGHAPMRWRS